MLGKRCLFFNDQTMKNLTKTLLLTVTLATASVIAMEEYNKLENSVQQPVQQPVLSPEMEAFRPIAEAVLFKDDSYTNDFLQTGEPTIESLVRYAYNVAMIYHGEAAAQKIYNALEGFDDRPSLEEIQKIVDEVIQQHSVNYDSEYSNGGSEYSNN